MRTIDLETSQGAAVLGLLERARVPPVPEFYGLLYDYVAGVESLRNARIGVIIADGDGAGGSVHEQLYAEFVAPYEHNETLVQAVARMADRLGTLDVLLGESLAATAAHAEALDGAGAQFGRGVDPRLLEEWIARLRATHQRLRQANTSLSGELVAAHAELEQTRAELRRSRELSLHDPLTGLINRAGLDLRLCELLAFVPTGRAVSCAVLDIDHFKSLNDGYGHQTGDAVLRIVAEAMLAGTRAGDLVARLGGDEFAVVFADARIDDAIILGERLRQSIAAGNLRSILGDDILGGITVSVGVAGARAGDTVTSLFERADRGLYRAKSAGRNRVIVEDGPR